MITKTPHPELDELRHLLRRLMRGLWNRRRPGPGFLEEASDGPRLTRRHVAVLAQIGTEGERTVGELAEELGVSLPAASKLSSELEERALVERREDPADRRRTVVALNPLTTAAVRAWLDARNGPLERTLAALDSKERAAFLKGLQVLTDALMEESPDGPLRSHHRSSHRRRPHRHRSI